MGDDDFWDGVELRDGMNFAFRDPCCLVVSSSAG